MVKRKNNFIKKNKKILDSNFVFKSAKKIDLKKLNLGKGIRVKKLLKPFKVRSFSVPRPYKKRPFFNKSVLSKLNNRSEIFSFYRRLFSINSSFAWCYSWYFSKLGTKINYLLFRNRERDVRLINIVKRVALRNSYLSPIANLPFENRFDKKKRLDYVGLTLTEVFKPVISAISSRIRVPFRIVLAFVLSQNRLESKEAYYKRKHENKFRYNNNKKIRKFVPYKQRRAKYAFLFIDRPMQADVVWNSLWDYAIYGLRSSVLRRESIEFLIELSLKYKLAHRGISKRVLSEKNLKTYMKFLVDKNSKNIKNIRNFVVSKDLAYIKNLRKL